MNWSEYLVLAKALAAAKPSTPAHLRSAISRAYYAALHEGKRYIGDKHPEIPIPKHKLHEFVWNTLQTLDVLQAQDAGATGASLCVTRNDADYKKNAIVTDRSVGDAIKEADRIYALLHAARKTPQIAKSK